MTARAVAAAPVLPDPEQTQVLIEAHLRSDIGGKCVTCRQEAPCHLRNLAHAAFFVAGRLPQRRRGLDLRPASGTRFQGFGEQARVVAAVHVPDDAGFCRGCLEVARLAWSPCPHAVWGLAMLTAVEAGEPR